jgi:hypothetical protein
MFSHFITSLAALFVPSVFLTLTTFSLFRIPVHSCSPQCRSI